MSAPPEHRAILTEYILAHQADFYRLAYSYVKDRDAALDVVQESIVKALTKAGSLREPAYVKTWFYRILVNESITWFRQGSGWSRWRISWSRRPRPSVTPASGWICMTPWKSSAKRNGRSSACAFLKT